MKIYLSMNGNRVQGWASNRGNDNDIEIEVEDDHEVLKNPLIFTYDNQLVKDAAYQQQLIQEQEELANIPTTEQQLKLMQKAIDDMILGGML
jgi:hypothetical protein